MIMLTTIKTLALSQMTLGSHVQFHTDIYNTIRKLTAAALHLEDVVADYAQEIAVENTIVKRPGPSVFTPEIRIADKLRSEYNALLFKVIDAYALSPNPVQKEAALKLQSITSGYSGMTRSRYNKQSAQITGLLIDLNSDEMREALEVFNLGMTVDGLRQANNRFVDLIARRDSETAVRSSDIDMSTREQRGIVDNLYRKVMQIVTAYSIIDPSDINAQFIDTVNSIIDRYKRDIARASKNAEKNVLPTPVTTEIATNDAGDFREDSW